MLRKLKRNIRRGNKARSLAEALEQRALLTNFAVTSAFLVDGQGSPMVQPIAGEQINVRVLYDTSDIDATDYRIEFRVGGVPLDAVTDQGTGAGADGSWNLDISGWYATPGSQLVEVFVDADDAVSETNEADNTFSFTVTTQAASPPSRFQWPLEGTIQRDGFITNYADTDPTPTLFSDYTGGIFSEDGHTGWDITTAHYTQLDDITNVVAAASGTVAAVGDGGFDRNVTETPTAASNEVVIDHGNGYRTRYTNLRRDSVQVQVGDVVSSGDLLGYLGGSGVTDGPELGFTITRNDSPIEPLLAASSYLTDSIAYSGATQFVRAAGVTDESATPNDRLPEEPSRVNVFDQQTQQVTAWAQFAALKDGQEIEFVFFDPNGAEVTRASRTINGDQKIWNDFFKREITDPLIGEYTLQLKVEGDTLATETFSFTATGAPELLLEDAASELIVHNRYTPVDFGSAPVGGTNPEVTLTVTNNGRTPLDISSVDDSITGFTVTSFPASLAAGESGDLTIELSSTIAGNYAGEIFIHSNDYDTPAYRFSVEGLIDDPAAEELVVGIGLRTIEESGGRTVANIRRTGDTTSALFVQLTSDEAGQVTLPDNVTIPAGSDSFSFFIEAVDDPTVEGDMFVEIRAMASGLSGSTNTLEIIDDDFADLVVVETDADTTVDESGTTDTFTVALNTQPLSSVLINVASGNLAESTVTPTVLTFTSATWDIPQTVTVTGVDDAVLDGTQNSSISIAVDSAFSDDAFDGIARTVVAATTDDEIAGILVRETQGTTQVSENGTTDRITVELTSQPLQDVVIDLVPSDPGEAVPVPNVLRFTASNWNVPQTARARGVDDLVLDGTRTSTFTLRTNDAQSYDPYDGQSTTIAVTTTDNDSPALSLTHTSGSTTVSESGTSDIVNVTLDVQPLSDVVLNVSSLNIAEATISPAVVTFTPGNWSTPQQLTVTGVDEAIADGDQFVTIQATVDNASSNAAFANTSGTISVTNLDDDAALVVSETAGSTDVGEAGAPDTFTVQLLAIPLGDVEIEVTSTDTGEATVSPTRLTFTTADWNLPQTVTVQGEDDDVVDGTQNATVNLRVINGASHFAFADVEDSLAVTIIDDEVPSLVITPTGGSNSVAERGTSDTVEVTLSAQPLGNVVMHASSPDRGEVLTPSTRLTFNSTNWNVPQSITVLGVDDVTLDGDQVTPLSLSIIDSQSEDLWDSISQTFNVTTVDNELPTWTITESNGGTETNESGGSDTFTLILNSQPLTNVLVDIISQDTTEFSANPTRLTFTPTNWNIVRTVTVTGVDDPGVDGAQMGTLSLETFDSGTDDAWDALSGSITATNIDDDIAGIVITQSGGSTEAVEGTTDSFDVTLNAQPLGDVVIDVLSSDVGEAPVSPARLTFTPATWNTPQSVTMTATDDLAADGDTTLQISVAVDDASSHDQFDGLAELIDATIFDNDAGITIVQSDGATAVNETGTTDTFTVVLDGMPSTDVILAVVSSDSTEATATPVALTFTPANFDQPQTVTVTGVDDVTLDGDRFSGISITVQDGSSDDAYDGFEESVSVRTDDDDIAAITIVETGGNTTVTEQGDTDNLAVSLSAQPLSTVILQVSGNDSGEIAVAPATLTFTPSNWNTSQSVTLTGVDDSPVDGDQISTITIAVDDAQSDNGFDGTSASVFATTIDDEVAGITVEQSDGTTEIAEEGTTTDTFTVTLDAEPTSNVEIELISTDTTEATVSLEPLTFTPANWNVPQVVTVTAVDEPTVDGTQESLIHVRVIDATSDDTFDGLIDSTVRVITTSDDIAGFSLHETGCETVVTEAGTSDTFTVVLDRQPVTGIVFNTSTDDNTELAVSPAQLTFTSENWNVPQTITVTGRDDDIADTNGPFGVFVEIEDGRSDNEFDRLPRQKVAVLNLNDEPTSAVDDIVNTTQGATINIDVLANDTPNPGSRVVSFTDPANGVAELRPNGRIRYTPEPNFTGTDTFSYSIVGDQGKLIGPGGQQGDEFGHAVAMDGDFAVVGVPRSDVLAEDAGIAFVYQRRSDGSWGKVTSISAPDGETNDAFGWSVDIDGDTVVVGARSDDDRGRNAGAVYVFDRNTGGADNFGFVTKLTNADGATRDQYGHSVATDGDTIIVGSRLDDDQGRNSGSAFVYDNVGGNWTLTTELIPTTLVQGDQFGFDVAVDGDFFLVGARKTNGAKTDDGSAFLFERNNGGTNNFGLVTQFFDPDPTNFDWLGQAVDIRNDTVVIGKPIRNGRQRTGEVLVFERNAGGTDNWGLAAQVEAPDGGLANQFGYALALNDTDLFVGARLDQTVKQNAGGAYQFDGASGWTLERSIESSDAQKGDYFGSSIAATNDGLFISSPRDDDNGGRSGSIATEDFNTVSANVTITVTAPLLAAEVSTGTDELTYEQLASAIDAGIEQWLATGITTAEAQLLRSLNFGIVNYDGAQLGGAAVNDGSIFIDSDAAGFGWSEAGYDLDTVVTHELGHILGHEDLYDAQSRNDIMFGILERGEQRTIETAPVAADSFFKSLGTEENLFDF